MTKTPRFILALAVVAVISTPILVRGADEAARKTLKGSYTWDASGGTGSVTAVFEPVAEKLWKVHFTAKEANGEDVYDYTGTAKGEVCQGRLEGRVVFGEKEAPTFQFDPNFQGGAFGQGGQVFTFKGEFKDGRFVGTHGRLEGDVEVKEGTLTLSK